MEESFIFNLSKEISYEKKGDPDCKTATLEFRPVDIDQFNPFSALKQLVMNAMMESTRFAPKIDAATKEAILENNKENPEPTTDEIKQMLYSAKDTQFTTIADKFRVLAKKTGTVDGEVKITDVILDRLGVKDYENMICGYVSFFFGASLFSEE